MFGKSVDEMRNVRYYIEDHRLGAFEKGAPTTDVLDVTGRPAEDFETIARRYAALESNRRTLRNRLRTITEFFINPVSPGFNFSRYDRELRQPFPSRPQFSTESKVWRHEHGIKDKSESATPGPGSDRTAAADGMAA
jgi:NAD(P)H dehydrogenase (quinone)